MIDSGKLDVMIRDTECKTQVGSILRWSAQRSVYKNVGSSAKSA